MKKRLLSGLTAFVICALMLVAPLSMPTYAATTTETGSGRLWNEFLNSDYDTFEEFINPRQGSFGTGSYRAGDFGAERGSSTSGGVGGYRGGAFTTPKEYYYNSSQSTTEERPYFTITGHSSSVRTVYESGQSVYTPLITGNKTYNTITNTYDYSYTYNDYITYNTTNNINKYDITNIKYSPTYNTYQITTNTNNYYISNNYTYITVMYYDSENDENVKQDLYFELPDGRNSFDLTADDVFGEYFIYNVQNYDLVLEDDGVTLGLYHLDGSFVNSSASNLNHNLNSSAFTFTDGIFNNALIQSPSSKGDFNFNFDFNNANTIEFFINYSSTYYSSSSSTVSKRSTVVPTYLSYSDGLTVSSIINISIPTDCWNHLAFVRKNGNTFSVFVNGIYQNDILITNLSLSTLCTNFINNSVTVNGVYQEKLGSKSYYCTSFMVDELRLSSAKLYTDNFSPPQQAYDTNSVLVLPDTADENDIFIKSKYDISDYRVGGVRPTYPTNGFLYIYLENDIVKDIQQYQEDGWYSVDARLYADGEFIDLKEYNMSEFTFIGDDSDDSGNNDGSDDSGDSGNSGGTTDDSDTDFSIIGKLVKLITGFLGELFDSVLGGILDLVNILIDNLRGLLDSFTGITGLIGSLFGFFPSDMISVLTIGLSAIFILAIIKMFKG